MCTFSEGFSFLESLNHDIAGGGCRDPRSLHFSFKLLPDLTVRDGRGFTDGTLTKIEIIKNHGKSDFFWNITYGFSVCILKTPKLLILSGPPKS